MADYALINSTTGVVENWIVWDGVSTYAPVAGDQKPAVLTAITAENAAALAVPQPVVDPAA